MKFVLIGPLLLSLAAFAASEKLENTEYRSHDDSANPGNPGGFTSKGPNANVPETKLDKTNHPKFRPELQAQEETIPDKQNQKKENMK